MQEAIYPVPQGAAVGVGPSHLVFQLPDTLPVVLPIQGLPRDPTVAGQPKLIFVTADIVSASVLRGVTRDPFTVGAPKLLLATTEIVSRALVRGAQQEPLIVGPPKLLLVTADIVSRAVLQGLPQSPFAVGLPTLFPVPTPAAAAPLAVQFPLRGLPQDPLSVGPPMLVSVPLAEVVSRITLRGLPQDLLTVGPPTLSKFFPPGVVILPVQRPLMGLVQDLLTVGPSRMLKPTIAEIVSRAMLRGLQQDPLTVVGLPLLLKVAPTPILAVQMPLRGIVRDPFTVNPSVIVRPAKPEIVSGAVLRGLPQLLLTMPPAMLLKFPLPLGVQAGLIFVTREGGLIVRAIDEGGHITGEQP